MPDDSLMARASGKLKAAASATLTRENAKKALSTKLVAVGLAAIFFATGVDYFENEDKVHRVLATAAHDAGQHEVAGVIEVVDESMDHLKGGALAAIPPAVREHLAGAALALGLLSLASGVRMKVRASSGKHGRVMRDMGGAIAGPGLIAVILYVYVSWRGAIVIRSAMGSFFGHVFRGELSGPDVKELTFRYAPWAWQEVGGVLLIGLAFAAFSGALRLVERRIAPRTRLDLEVTRRTATAAAVLSLSYYACATLVAVTSLGGALRVIAWPWKIDAPAFLVTLALMSFGIGLGRAGALLHRREEGEKPPAPKKPTS
ncbi:hypothetical protein HY251_15880 [bacterium]|nr:hypothetical protein [bacterium]